MTVNSRRGRTAALALLAALGVLYTLLRRPILTWGATSDEAASRRRTHLHKPRPDGRSRRVDRDGTRRDAVCVFE